MYFSRRTTAKSTSTATTISAAMDVLSKRGSRLRRGRLDRSARPDPGRDAANVDDVDLRADRDRCRVVIDAARGPELASDTDLAGGGVVVYRDRDDPLLALERVD